MAVETLNEKTIKVEKMSVLDGVVWAFALSMSTCLRHWKDLSGLTTLIYAMAFLLDRIGQLVCLTRQQAGTMIGSRELADNDDVYRICLKYKAYVNSCHCTSG